MTRAESSVCGTTLMPSQVHVGPADKEGNTCQQVINEPRTASLGGVENPSGANGGKAQPDLDELPWDSLVELSEVRKHFEAKTPKMKESSRADYWYYFRKFDEDVHVGRYTKRQLAGAKGKDLILEHIGHLAPFIRSTHMYGVKKVWVRGLGLAWPVDRDDLPPIPSPRLVPGPRRADIEPWVQAAKNERDPYERAWFFVELTYGFRPVNQQAHLRRRNLVFNEATGKVLGIVANGTEEDFKKDSYVIAAFPPDVADAVERWLKVHPDASQDAWLFPWRDVDGQVDPKRQAAGKVIRAMRKRFARRWNLQWVDSKATRKFVKGVLIDAGMPDPFKPCWQGHRPNRADMNAVYGVRPWEEMFASQLAYVPTGPMGIFGMVKTDSAEIPSEVVELWRRFKAKEIDAQDVADGIKSLDRKQPALGYVGK